MKRIIFFIFIALTTLVSIPADAQQSPWLLRARAVHIDPENKSDPLNGVGRADRISVESKEILELDVVYFFSPNFSTELTMNNRQRHNVSLDGPGIGSVKVLPIALNVQYHPFPELSVKPYIGLGVNYTDFSDVHLLNQTGTLDGSSSGWSAQVGVDFSLDKNWSVNVDIKKLKIRSDLAINGVKAGEIKIDPWFFGVGLGYRF